MCRNSHKRRMHKKTSPKEQRKIQRPCISHLLLGVELPMTCPGTSHEVLRMSCTSWAWPSTCKHEKCGEMCEPSTSLSVTGAGSLFLREMPPSQGRRIGKKYWPPISRKSDSCRAHSPSRPEQCIVSGAQWGPGALHSPRPGLHTHHPCHGYCGQRGPLPCFQHAPQEQLNLNGTRVLACSEPACMRVRLLQQLLRPPGWCMAKSSADVGRRDLMCVLWVRPHLCTSMHASLWTPLCTPVHSGIYAALRLSLPAQPWPHPRHC